MLLAIGSVMFVFLYIVFHTRSWFLAGFGMLHILLSFPACVTIAISVCGQNISHRMTCCCCSGFLVYRFIFGIEVFFPLAALAVYIILAIGADGM